MMRHLARPMVRALAAATLLGSSARFGLSSAVSLAQRADSGIAAGTVDLAQDTDTPSGSATTTPMQGNHAKQPAYDPLAARIKYLHDRLRITPAQEPLWADLAQVMRENAKSVAPLLKERLQAAKSGNAIDTLSADEKLSEAQLDGFKKFTTAFQALYNSLTDGQKKIADAMFRPPQLSEQLGTPSPYAYYPSYPTLPSYPAYPYYPPYSYYPYYSFLFLGPVIGLERSFFFSRHPGFFPFRPPVHRGFPPGRAAVMHGQFGRR